MAAPGKDPVSAAVDKLKKQQESAAAMEKARAQLGLMTKEAEKAARAQDRLNKAKERTAALDKRNDARAAAKAAAEAARAAKEEEKTANKLTSMRKKASERAEKDQAKNLARMKKDQERAAKEAEKAANKEASKAASQAAENAAAAEEAEAAALGMVEAAALAAAAAVVALVAATVAAMHKIAELIGEMNILRAQFMALGKTPGIGAASLDSLKTLSRTLPFAESKVVEWGQSLMMAKLQGRDLENAIKAVAGAAALMGDKGAAAAQHMIETLARGGVEAASLVQKLKMGLPDAQAMLADVGLRVEDIAKALNTTVAGLKNMRLNARQMAEAIEKALAAKAAGPLAEMMLSLPVIVAKAKEAFLSLFDKLGPSVKPFLKAVQSLFGQFGKGSGPIRALQKIVTDVFGTLFKYATMAVKAVSAFVKQNITAKNIGGVWKEIRGAIGTVVTVLGVVWKVLRPIVTSPLFLKGLVTVFKVVAVVLGIVVSAFAALFVVMTVIAGAFVTLGTMIWGALGYVFDFLAGLADLESGAVSAAGNFIAGLVGGITGGAGAVVDAVKALAASAVQGLKSALGIASPSKVMERMGDFASQGMAEGLDGGSGQVGAASARMAGAAAGGAASGLAGGAKGKGSVTVNVQAGAVVINAAGSTVTDEGLAVALERLVLAQGLGAT